MAEDGKLYENCRCLPKDLALTLKEAIGELKAKKLPEYSAKLKERELAIDAFVEQMEKIGQKFDRNQLIGQLGVSSEEKLFDELGMWANSCECPDKVDVKWNEFPHTEYGFGSRAERTTTATKPRGASLPKWESLKAKLDGCGLPPNEVNEIIRKTQLYENKYLDAFRNPITQVYLKNRYPNEKDITHSVIKAAMVPTGMFTPEEYDEWERLRKKIKEICPTAGDIHVEAGRKAYEVRTEELLYKTKPRGEYSGLAKVGRK